MNKQKVPQRICRRVEYLGQNSICHPSACVCGKPASYHMVHRCVKCRRTF